MGLYDVPMFMFFLGFGIGMMFADLNVCVMVLLFNTLLYMSVRYASPSGPMYLRCLLLILLGTVELLILHCFVAS